MTLHACDRDATFWSTTRHAQWSPARVLKRGLEVLLMTALLTGCDDPAAVKRLDTLIAMRQAMVIELTSLEGPAARAQYDAEVAKLEAFGLPGRFSSELPLNEAFAVDWAALGGSEAHGHDATWRGATREKLLARFDALKSLWPRLTVLEMSVTDHDWQVKIADAIVIGPPRPSYGHSGVPFSQVKKLDAQLTQLDADITNARSNLGDVYPPSYVKTALRQVKRNVETEDLSRWRAIVALLPPDTTLEVNYKSQVGMHLVFEPPPDPDLAEKITAQIAGEWAGGELLLESVKKPDALR